MHSILEIIEETTASAGPDLISLDDLKLALGITGTDEDAALAAMITLQSQIIAEYCDRRLGRAEALETFSFDPGETLPMRQGLTLSLYPVVEIAEVSTAGATGADYHFDPASGRLWLPATQYTGFWVYGPYNYAAWPNTVTVNYTGGYDLPEQAPARLQKAVIEAIHENRSSGSRDPSIREVQHGDTRISYFTSTTSSSSEGYLSAPVIDLIKPYRKLYVA
jgi:Phage gp6-like head-tail connector protein